MRKAMTILSIPAFLLALGAFLVWAMSPITPVGYTPVTITLPSPLVTPTPELPTCELEDGSGQALCMWDASEQGNGVGTDVVAGDCSIDTVGTASASAQCILLWDTDVRFSYGANGSVSETHKGSELVADCLDIEFEASQDSDIRNALNNDGWNLEECFKAHIQN